MIPPLGHLGLFEYRLKPQGERLALPDLSMPMPAAAAVAEVAAWQPLLPLLQHVDACLHELSDLLCDPWLEFDQPGTSAPGVGLRLRRRANVAELQRLSSCLTPLLPGLTPPPSALQLDLPEATRPSHLGLFVGRGTSEQRSWRCNLVGPMAQQWKWITAQLPDSATVLQGCEAMAWADWSATFDWCGRPLPRLGIELFARGRLQQGSSLGDPAVAALLQAAAPLAPAGSLERSIAWHHQRLGRRFAASFSHLKLVADPGQRRPLQLKLYLLAHAPV